ncbi:NlpC/P60 family protein [Paenactinomyces guangxiensis]|uniref:C40 family peptidase n=1 Tax=Paenactinomyces guangxiensis TaxID=1490290 RepID=A0A7W2A7I7_9BACL|nr:C40 family peptidase [Paenactinomyces guangxiensis]MBA4493595.1 C40 family peptidase [Paenactinomyces guangxiensis]MBH8590882.1 C40 family peptidase [Paenactinomyces guangxiensis]
MIGVACLLIAGLTSGSFAENVKETAYIDVAAASLWTEPGLVRPVDEPSATNPVGLWKWTRSMSVDEKRWLVGKLETQALLGNKVTVTERRGDWVKVVVHGQGTPRDERGYPGWMPAGQLTYNKQFAAKEHDPFVQVTKPTAMLYSTPDLAEEMMEVSYNTRLPLLGETDDAYRLFLPDGSGAWLKKRDGVKERSPGDIPVPTGEQLVETARLFQGLPYLWAGTSGFGYDCSGFTFTVYQSHGISIPRDAAPQSQAGTPVAKDQLPGDLVFFASKNGKGPVHHVGIYAGSGMMVHSPNSGKSVEIIPLDSPAYKKEYAGARRYLPQTGP